MPGLPHSLLRRAVLATAAFALLAGTAQAIPRGAKLTTAGLGPLEIGMTVKEVERVIGRDVRRRGAGTGDCTTGRLGKGVGGLFTGRRLARITVTTARHRTRSGVRVGDTEQEVHAVYQDRIETEPHAYHPDGHYLKLVDGDRKVVFETDGRRVASISAGRTPEVDYVEGCA